MGSSLNVAMVSSVMYLARWTAHSSFCSGSSATDEPDGRLIDALNAHLREQRAEDLMGEAGAASVRQALKKIVDDALAPSQVKAVLFRKSIVS